MAKYERKPKQKQIVKQTVDVEEIPVNEEFNETKIVEEVKKEVKNTKPVTKPQSLCDFLY